MRPYPSHPDPEPPAPTEAGDVVAPADAGGNGGVRRQTVIAATSSLLGGALNAGVLAVCARDGQTGELAAYAVMTAALAWVSILVAGGTSLLYSSGNERERAMIRSQRVLLVAPLLCLSAVGVAAVYGGRGYSVAALAAAALGAIGNTFTELQFGDLARQFRFVAASFVTVGSRVAGLVLVLGGVPLTRALAAAALLQLLAGEILVRQEPGARHGRWGGLTFSSAIAVFRMNRQLMSYSLAELFTGRSGAIALSFAASPHVLGGYAAVNGVYQALGAVLYQGLRVPMAVRVRRRHGLGKHGSGRESEVLIVVMSALTGAVGWLLAPWISTGLLGLDVPGTAVALQFFALALPFLTINRAVGLARLGDGDYRTPARLAAVTAGLVGLALLVQTPHFGAAGAAAATLVGELSATMVVATLYGALALRARRRDPISATAPVPAGRTRTAEPPRKRTSGISGRP